MRIFALGAAVAIVLASASARAESIPAWPVRLNLQLPLGYTYGNDRLHGFTWGLRATGEVYPTASHRGAGFGLYGETLLDAQTHSLWTLGGTFTAPVMSSEMVDWRVGGVVGRASKGTGADGGTGLAIGALTSVALPAYLYDFRLGLRVNGVFSGGGVVSTSLLVDLDLVGLLGAMAWAAGSK